MATGVVEAQTSRTLQARHELQRCLLALIADEWNRDDNRYHWRLKPLLHPGERRALIERIRECEAVLASGNDDG